MRAAHVPELEEKSFAAGPLTINYAVGPANGPPLVLLHGVGRNWQDFLSLIPDFCANRQVYALDLRGHGKSARVPHGYTSSAYAGDVIQFLRKAIGRPAVLFGHSLGGVVGLQVAGQYGDDLSALILGDSVLSNEGLSHPLYDTLFRGLHEVALQGGAIAEIARKLAKIEVPIPMLEQSIPLGDFPGNDEDYFRRWAVCLQQVDPEVFAMTLDGSSLADLNAKELLPKIQCPTLMLQASADLGGLMSDAEVDMAMRLLPKATRIRFPLLGHALHLQQPQPVLAAVQKFLHSLPADT